MREHPQLIEAKRWVKQAVDLAENKTVPYRLWPRVPEEPAPEEF